MSQIQSFIGSGGPGGGPVLSLQGDSGGVIAPNGAGNINILGENNSATNAFAQVVGNPATHTLSILPVSDAVITNNAVATFFPVALALLFPSSTVVMTATVIGHRDDFSASCGGFATGVARRGAAGGTVFVGDNALANEDAPVGVPQFGIGVNGNNIGVYAQGLAGQTWNWTCTYTYQFNLI
jgi:hypothetical protein